MSYIKNVFFDVEYLAEVISHFVYASFRRDYRIRYIHFKTALIIFRIFSHVF